MLCFRMSFPEHTQKPEHHRACKILVRPIGSFVVSKDFTTIYDHLEKLHAVALPAEGRHINFQFVTDYPTENNEWGDFQYHRKILGMICIAQYNESTSFGDLEKYYSDMKNLYDSTLLDSRLVILGLPRRTTDHSSRVIVNAEEAEADDDDHGLVINVDHFDEKGNGEIMADNGLNSSEERLLAELSDVTRKLVLCYSDASEALSFINIDIEYMCQSMFYVLEHKRLAATKSTNLRQPTLLAAPFEKTVIAGIDFDTK